MTTKSTKQSGTKTSASRITPKERVANRVKKIAAKHEAIRVAGKTAPAAHVSMEQKVANAAGEALAGKPAPSVNPLISARGSQFTDALNAATVAQLEEAVKHPGMANQYRNRIGIALKLRTTPADDVAETVAAVTTGDLTKGIEVPTGHRAAKERGQLATGATGAAGSTKDAITGTGRNVGQTGGTKAKTERKPGGKMSGLDAAAKVLAESAEPLNAKRIVEQAAAKGYWTSPGGRTPAATVYSAMLTNSRKGDQARFKKVDRGLWALTVAAKAAIADAGKQAK